MKQKQVHKSNRLVTMLLLVMEFLKILATCMLLGLTAVWFSGLVWPAMIFGIIAAAVSVFLLPIFNH